MNDINDERLQFLPRIFAKNPYIPWIVSKKAGKFYFVKMDGTNRYGEPGPAARDVEGEL